MLLIKRTFKKRTRGDSGYTLIQAMRAFALACNADETAQPQALLDLLTDLEEKEPCPLSIGRDGVAWIMLRVLESFHDARAEKEDQAARTRKPAPSYDGELEFKFRNNAIVTFKLHPRNKEREVVISLADHDSSWSIWMSCPEHVSAGKLLVARAKAMHDGMEESIDVPCWGVEGADFELEPHERWSLSSVISSLRHRRLC